MSILAKIIACICFPPVQLPARQIDRSVQTEHQAVAPTPEPREVALSFDFVDLNGNVIYSMSSQEFTKLAATRDPSNRFVIINGETYHIPPGAISMYAATLGQNLRIPVGKFEPVVVQCDPKLRYLYDPLHLELRCPSSFRYEYAELLYEVANLLNQHGVVWRGPHATTVPLRFRAVNDMERVKHNLRIGRCQGAFCKVVAEQPRYTLVFCCYNDIEGPQFGLCLNFASDGSIIFDIGRIPDKLRELIREIPDIERLYP